MIKFKMDGDMNNIFIAIISVLLLASCTLPGEAFIVNRSGKDVVVYAKNIGSILKDGCDDIYSPLRSSYFTTERLKIKECPAALYRTWKCPDIQSKDFGNVAEKIDALHNFQEKTGKRAAYLLDENFNLLLVPYDGPFKGQRLENGRIICK